MFLFSSHHHSPDDDGRRFSWMPTLDGYILRAFLIPFFILLFAFTLLFIIMDMYNDVGDFLDNKASVSISVKYFLLKIPGNIRFILPITVLLACMYALANLGRTKEALALLDALRDSTDGEVRFKAAAAARLIRNGRQHRFQGL